MFFFFFLLLFGGVADLHGGGKTEDFGKVQDSEAYFQV